MEDYIASLVKLADEAWHASITLDDGEVYLIALNGLDASYEAFVMARSSQTNDLGFAKFQGILLAYEGRMTNPVEQSLFPSSANVIQSKDEQVEC